MTTEATFPPFTTDGLFAEEAALFDAIVSIVMALVVMIVLSVFIWRLIYRDWWLQRMGWCYCTLQLFS